MAYVLDITGGRDGMSTPVLHLPVATPLTLGQIPQFCLPGSTITLVDLEKQELSCRLDDLAPNEILTRAVTVHTNSAIAGTSTPPVVAVLNADNIAGPLSSHPVTVQFVDSDSGCDPLGTPIIGEELRPADPAHATRAAGRIAVTAENSDRTPRSFSLIGSDSCGHHIERQLQSNDGTAIFAGLMPGRYTMQVQSPRQKSISLPVELTSSELAVELHVPAQRD
ncbi:hypothetical protein [Rhodococcus triatomae]